MIDEARVWLQRHADNREAYKTILEALGGENCQDEKMDVETAIRLLRFERSERYPKLPVFLKVRDAMEMAINALERTRWVPVEERLPKPETEVMIVCNRNDKRFIATAIYEDGTLFKEDSDWGWNDIWEYGNYDEERDDYIIPEGWWESRCFTPDDYYNCPVDCEVTHWRPMPEPPGVE